MQPRSTGRCESCGAREPMLRAVYDFQRAQKDGRWLWLGTARALCSGCFADPRRRARWIDERQKRTPDKPQWAKDEPEVLAAPRPGTASSAAHRRGTKAKRASPPPARSSKTGSRAGRRRASR